ncbi:MAG: hypothetical protein ABIR79_08700 [Candidatus Binatia bacterium]
MKPLHSIVTLSAWMSMAVMPLLAVARFFGLGVPIYRQSEVSRNSAVSF